VNYLSPYQKVFQSNKHDTKQINILILNNLIMNNITYDARFVKTVRTLKSVTGKKIDEAQHESDNTSSKMTCSSENSKEDKYYMLNK